MLWKGGVDLKGSCIEFSNNKHLNPLWKRDQRLCNVRVNNVNYP